MILLCVYSKIYIYLNNALFKIYAYVEKLKQEEKNAKFSTIIKYLEEREMHMFGRSSWKTSKAFRVAGGEFRKT